LDTGFQARPGQAYLLTSLRTQLVSTYPAVEPIFA